MFITISKELIEKVEKITLTDYEYNHKKNNMPLENIESLIEDLLLEIERQEERYKELDEYVTENYETYPQF